jgi:short-subunit dehydrogenase
MANYAATKAHQVNLAEALYYELRPYGVDVLGLSPGLTQTPMVGRLGRRRTSTIYRPLGLQTRTALLLVASSDSSAQAGGRPGVV